MSEIRGPGANARSYRNPAKPEFWALPFEKWSTYEAIMNVRHRINNQFDIMIRILCECSACDPCE